MFGITSIAYQRRASLSLLLSGLLFSPAMAQPGPANLFICDAPVCVNGVTSPEPLITFTSSGFVDGAAGFQVNSNFAQGIYSISEHGTDINGAAEIDFSGVWASSGAVTPENQTIFFYDNGDPAAIGDVLHVTFSQTIVADQIFGHIDGTVISDNDAFGPLSVAGLNAIGIFATGTLPESGATMPYFFNNTDFKGAFQSDVPELSTWAMMLVGFAGLGYAAFSRARKAPVAIS